MDKIYTRHKIRIPELRSNWRGSSRKNKKFFISIIMLLICTVIITIMVKAIHPVFDDLCKEKAKSMATIISNEQATEVMRDYSYNNIFDIEKDNNGK